MCFSSDPVEMKIDIHSHILPKEWPDLNKVRAINLLNYFWNVSGASQSLCYKTLFFCKLDAKFLCFGSGLKLFGSSDFQFFF